MPKPLPPEKPGSHPGNPPPINIYMITANTIWVLILMTPGGVESLQSIHQSQETCQRALRTYVQSRYYTAKCQQRER